MIILRPLLLAILLLIGAGSALAQQRDTPEKAPAPVQPTPPPPLIQQPQDKGERSPPVLQSIVAELSAVLVLYVVCKPSRKGLPT